ncbi:hypothetical protein [Leptolyngbya sp. PCC 6406]|uniref:hypothetical protein n=1 Tax=Leptolyngbya sp. PCC 6406 TaxID=1173264 RepID=UPI0002D6E551|nr:hypothetical protein [Leptolyngbya sp. PCC 6406]
MTSVSGARAGVRLRPLLLGGVMGGMITAIAACSRGPVVPPREIALHQKWALQPGSEVGGYRVMGGLGDVSIELEGKPVHAPFDGKVQPTDHDCVAFTSPEVPAYLFRLCGLRRPRLGNVQAGDPIGKGAILQFAAMRRQPDGTWALVEPSVGILERTVGE